MRKHWLFFLFYFVSFGASASDQRSIFGFVLGKPPTLRECQHSPISGYSGPTSYVCIKPDNRAPGFDNGWFLVRFPWNEKPAVTRSNEITVRLFSGMLEGVSFETGGIGAQSEVLAALSEKYGKPTKLESITSKNLAGASVQSIVASWDMPDLKVNFQAVRQSLDSGHVYIETPRAQKERLDRIREMSKDSRAL